jgi:HK97 family phage portal protein
LGFLRSLLNKLQPSEAYKMKLITDNGGGFYSWGGSIYKSDIIRACIRPKARAIGKLLAKHIREGPNGIQTNPEPYIRFLLEEPNPYMTGQVMQEKIATQLDLNNNAFILIVRDQNGFPYQMYPIPGASVEAKHDTSGNLFLKFYLKNGNIIQPSYNDVIHLRQDFNDDDLFGDNPGEVLLSLMEIVNTTDQGIVKAIKNSAVIKWIMTFKTVLNPDDKQLAIDDFSKNYLQIDGIGKGIASADPRYELKEVKPDSFVPNALQMDKTTERLYNYFNTNEKIVQSKYNEDDWNAYYESVIEPVAVQLSGEYTRKIFSRTERGFGNKIYFESSNLQYASMKTKLNLLHMVDRGAMTPNEWRNVLNMAPIAGGDEAIRRLDTAVVGGKGVTEDEDKN